MSGRALNRLVEKVNQSPPVDTTIPYDAAWVKGRTILITGGASGFGAAFARLWAEHGANIIVGDINVEMGDQLARQLRKETGNQHVHFVYCDVTDWQSQVDMFKEAARLSPHGGIDCVVANAGRLGKDELEHPVDLDKPSPPKPDFKTIDVNLIGVMYTTHIAIWWLKRNPGAKNVSPSSDPSSPRDRHILLVGSLGGMFPVTGAPLYSITKHAVLGVFRNLRATQAIGGIRVNMILPYFVLTPILPGLARMILAGGGTAKSEDVVDAATRLVADTRIVGRGLAIGPKAMVNLNEEGEWELVEGSHAGKQPQEKAIWEAYADDWEDCEVFNKRMVGIINGVARGRGWVAWFVEFFDGLWMALRQGRLRGG